MKPTRMTAADEVEVGELLRASYAALGEREGLSPEQIHFLTTTRGSLECVRSESRSERYYVVRDAGRIVGMTAVSGDAITKLYVSPHRTGEGIGRTLFETAEAVVRSDGHTRVTLGSFPTAVPFYTRMGMSVVGQKAAAGALAGVAVALMEKELPSASSMIPGGAERGSV